MKKIFLLSILVFFTIMIIDTKEVFADENLEKDKLISDDYFYEGYSGYRYPVLPKMSTWPYGNHQKMVDACNIPDEIIVDMSTTELLETVLAYPLFSDAILYNSQQEGYEVIKSYFKPLQELIKREDRCDCLIDFFKNKENNSKVVFCYDQVGNLKTNAMYESMSTAFVLMNTSDFPGVRDVCISNNDDLKKENIPLKSTLQYPLGFNKDLITQTIVQTPKQGPMDAYEYSVTEYWMNSDNDIVVYSYDDFSNAYKLYMTGINNSKYNINPINNSGPTVKYNCHSYAWYQQSSPFWWIYSYNSNGYSSVNMQNANINGIIVYFNSSGNNISYPLDYSHSARIISKIYGSSTVISFNLRSKWGASGLYNHTMENCPYYFYPDETYNIADRMYYNP